MNQNGTMIVPDVLDEVFSPKYDTYSAAANAAMGNEIVLFGVNASNGSNLEITNMQEPYKLINPESLDVYAVRVEMVGMAQVDIESIYKKYVLRLIIGTKTYLEAPLSYFPFGGGIDGGVAISTTNTSTTATAAFFRNGVADPRAVASLPTTHVIKIDAGQNFRVKLLSGAGYTLSSSGNGAFIRVYLDGLYRRAVA